MLDELADESLVACGAEERRLPLAGRTAKGKAKPAAKPAATKAPAAKKPAPRMTSATKGSTGGRKATTRRTSR